MMSKEDYQHFVCIVAGDNPYTLMEEYDKNVLSEPRVVYYYKDAKKIKKTYISLYENMLKESQFNNERNHINEILNELKEMSDDELFEDICLENENYYFDPETGDIMTNLNEKGKWSSYKLGKALSIPFLTKDGREVFQAKKNEIDWDKIHLSGKRVYERVWEMCMENSTPEDEHEKVLYENMKDKTYYFQKFENKDNYVISNTAFWGYAYLSEINGWRDVEDEPDQFMWMNNFYDVFIKNLPEDTLLTIFECRK